MIAVKMRVIHRSEKGLRTAFDAGEGSRKEEHIPFKGRDSFLPEQSVMGKIFLMCLKAAQKKSSEEKYIIFMELCENFQPVFRYFCMEKFLDPAVWFEKRLAYTRSVATSSIGMILKY